MTDPKLVERLLEGAKTVSEVEARWLNRENIAAGFTEAAQALTTLQAKLDEAIEGLTKIKRMAWSETEYPSLRLEELETLAKVCLTSLLGERL